MAETPIALFLFAHQDDEFGVFHTIEECLKQGMRVRCAYLTHGANGTAAQRNAESLHVLQQLGVPTHDITFAGDELDICDAWLSRRMLAAGRWLQTWMAGAGPVGLVCVPAWEGGHHDHDALHFLGYHIAARLGLQSQLRQYALYNSHRCPGPFFRVMSPLAHNGPLQRTPMPLRARLRYLRYCLSYPSQRVTWIGLFPFVLLHYMLDDCQQLQAAAIAPQARPHPGPLYYEKRRFYTWPQLQKDMELWLKQTN